MKTDRHLNKLWGICGYSAVEYAVYNDDLKSLTGYIVVINEVVIPWHLKIHKTVTLSNTEAEYSALTDVCCEILFVCAILLLMGVVSRYTITVHLDNVGAISLLENPSVYQQINHIDVCHNFICD